MIPKAGIAPFGNSKLRSIFLEYSGDGHRSWWWQRASLPRCSQIYWEDSEGHNCCCASGLILKGQSITRRNVSSRGRTFCHRCSNFLTHKTSPLCSAKVCLLKICGCCWPLLRISRSACRICARKMRRRVLNWSSSHFRSLMSCYFQRNTQDDRHIAKPRKFSTCAGMGEWLWHIAISHLGQVPTVLWCASRNACFKRMTQNMCHLSGAGTRDYKLMQDLAQFGRMDCFSMFFPWFDWIWFKYVQDAGSPGYGGLSG